MNYSKKYLHTNLKLIPNTKSYPQPFYLQVEKNHFQSAPTLQTQINYKLVQKTPVFYSMSIDKPKHILPRIPNTILSTDLHQFPQSDQKGLKFKNKTPRKDLLIGQPSPHEERLNSYSLIPKSCSKFNFIGSSRFDKYTDRKEFYIKKSFP